MRPFWLAGAFAAAVAACTPAAPACVGNSCAHDAVVAETVDIAPDLPDSKEDALLDVAAHDDADDTQEAEVSDIDAAQPDLSGDGGADLELSLSDVAETQDESSTGDAPTDLGIADISSPPTPSCAELPRWCGGTDQCVSWFTAKGVLANGAALGNYTQFMLAERLKYAYLQWFDYNALSFWRPAKLTALDAKTVRLWATWINQVMPSASIPMYPKQVCDMCQMVKASLLPSGCVQVDIDIATGTVVAVALTSAKPADFVLSGPDLFQSVGCAATIGAAPSTAPISLTTGSGLVVTAWPGRASVHKLLLDPQAEFAALVRDVGPVDAPLPATAAVVEFSTLAGSVTAVAIDVSICHATAQNVLDAGCPCPQGTDLPVGPPASNTESWFSFASAAWEVTVTTGYLEATEGPVWNGIGSVQSMPCRLDGKIDEPKALCAGWLKTTLAKPSILDVDAGGVWGGVSADIYLPDWQLTKTTPLPVVLTTSADVSVSIQDPKAAVPPQLRDSVWTNMGLHFATGPVTVTSWQAQATDVEFSGTAVISHKFASQITLSATLANPDAMKLSLHKVMPGTFKAHVQVKKPGEPLN
jgi:hypothetical protein